MCISSGLKLSKVRVNENAVAEVRDKMKLKLTQKKIAKRHTYKHRATATAIATSNTRLSETAPIDLPIFRRFDAFG